MNDNGRLTVPSLRCKINKNAKLYAISYKYGVIVESSTFYCATLLLFLNFVNGKRMSL